MKQYMILIFVALFGFQTWAASTKEITKEITCHFEALHPTATLTIAVDNIDNPKELSPAGVYSDYEGEETNVTFSGDEDIEWLYMLVSGYDSSFYKDAEGNIDYMLDSDGCDVGTFKLYRNNGYKFGYVKVEHRCSGRDYPDSYSKAKCTVSDYKE